MKQKVEEHDQSNCNKAEKYLELLLPVYSKYV